jgi:hypothetical protein
LYAGVHAAPPSCTQPSKILLHAAVLCHLSVAPPPPSAFPREYRRYWFFLNLQLAIDRALLGGQQSNSSLPSNLDVKVKPFPWPAKQEDIGAASAAVLLNLLLVYAFMAPTRGVVGSIVREKELRLREGMRILGLSVRCSADSWC